MYTANHDASQMLVPAVVAPDKVIGEVVTVAGTEDVTVGTVGLRIVDTASSPLTYCSD